MSTPYNPAIACLTLLEAKAQLAATDAALAAQDAANSAIVGPLLATRAQLLNQIGNLAGGSSTSGGQPVGP